MPTSASIPDNDETDSFDVLIDGDSPDPSVVLLSTDVTIATLSISSNDRLEINPGTVLQFGGTGGVAATGSIDNQGLIQLVDGPIGPRIASTGELIFSGDGVLDLGQLGTSSLAYTGQFTNALGHTIRGSGTFENLGSQFNEIFNFGTIEQTGTNTLTLERTRNSGVVRATGSGGLELHDRFINTGLLEIAAGSQLVVPFTSGSQGLANGGQIRITGAGTVATIDRLGSVGDFQALDGASVTINSSIDVSSGSRLLIQDSVLSADSFVRVEGRVVLDQGIFSVGQSLTFRGGGPGGQLEGSGSIVLRSPFPANQELILDGVLAPGIDGTGHIQVEGGRVDLSRGRFEIDLEGTHPSEADRLTVFGPVSIAGRTRFNVSEFGDFSPVVGDRFDLIVADEISTTSLALQPNFDLPTLGSPDHFLVAQILDGNPGDTLALGVAEAITAEWSSDSGDYQQSDSWSFSSSPFTATYATNDVASIFDVVIDNASGAVVTANEDLRIGSLAIGSGNVLEVANGHSLLLEEIGDRSENGKINVDGVLRLSGVGIGAQILSDGDIELTGSGLIDLGDNEGLKIRGSRDYSGFNLDAAGVHITLGEGLTVSGAGTLGTPLDPANNILVGTIENHGSIEADRANAMILGSGTNFGSIRATGTGGLSIGPGGIDPHATFRNEGLIEVGAGSALETTDAVAIANYGQIRIGGVGATASFKTLNRGELEIVDGAVVELLGFKNQGRLIVRNAFVTGGLLEPAAADSGNIELDDGDIAFETGSEPILFQRSRLEGTGRWGLTTVSGNPGSMEFIHGGTLAPGSLEDAGLLEIDASVTFGSTSTWEIDVFGASISDYDRVQVTGEFDLTGIRNPSLRLAESYAPAAGDVFDVLQATNITGFSETVANRFEFTQLDDHGLFYEIELVDDVDSDMLSIGIAAPVQASWTGGVGSYREADSWSFDVAQVPGTIPDGSSGEVFDVSVDNGAGTSIVSLDQAVSIRSLELGSGAGFVVGSGGVLRFATPLGNARSGGLTSDGLLRLEGGRIESDRGFGLRGQGVLELTDSIENAITIDGPGGGALDIGEEFTLRGSGTVIVPAGVTNRGLVEAGDGGTLTFLPSVGVTAAPFDNRGRLSVTNDSVVRIAGLLTSSGEVHVDTGGSLFVSGQGAITNSGLMSIEGSVAAARLENFSSLDIDGGTVSLTSLENSGSLNFRNGSIVSPNINNSGELVVGMGSILTTSNRYIQTEPLASTVLAGTLDLARGNTQVSIGEGSLTLRDGHIRGERFSRLVLGEAATLDGTGEIRTGSRRASLLSGIVSPGEDGVGAIDFGFDIMLTETSDLRLEVGEIGNVKEQDLLTVLGTTFLGGTVTLQELEGYAPEFGDFFDVVVATTLEDSGFILVAPALTDGLRWTSSIVLGAADQRLRVNVIPEPSTTLMLGFGLACFSASRRRIAMG